jgi:hypothetical protein
MINMHGVKATSERALAILHDRHHNDDCIVTISGGDGFEMAALHVLFTCWSLTKQEERFPVDFSPNLT